MRLTVELPGGRKDQLEFRLQRKYSPDTIGTFLQVTAPREQTDMALLATEQTGKATEAVSYLAGLKKTARLSSSSTLTFSETKVTVQELLGLELGQYGSGEGERAVEDGQSVVKYKLTAPAGRSLAFPQITAWFRESDMTPVKFELFGEGGTLQKTVKIEQVKDVEGHQTVMRSAIEDLPQKRTMRLETRGIKFNQGLSAGLFTEEHLIAVISGSSRRLLEGK
jgi:outer membrane lipoprotein-sorting protein